MRRTGRDSVVCRGWARTLAGVLMLASGGVTAAPAAADEWTLQTGAHVDAWSGGGQSGHQILLPFSLAFDTPDWGAGVRGAFGNSERDPGNAPSGSITGFVDTTLSGYYALTVAGIELRAGLGLDLPTGVSRLRATQLAAVQDEDLVTLERFGEGFDINPTLVAYRNFGAFGVGLGAGYLRRGRYDPTRDTPDDDFDPGDEFTVAVLGDVYVADAVRLLGRLAYTCFTRDTIGGVPVLREGDQLDFRLSAEWRPEPWWVVVAVRDIVGAKAERPGPTGALVTESHNSNGNDLRGSVTVGYLLTDAWSVEGTVAVRHVTANDYSAGDPLRDGGRTKVAFGPGVTWSPTRTFAIDAAVRYFILDAKQSPIFPADSTFHGVHADLRVTYRF